MAKFDLTGEEWSAIRQLLPPKRRGAKRCDSRWVFGRHFLPSAHRGALGSFPLAQRAAQNKAMDSLPQPSSILRLLC